MYIIKKYSNDKAKKHNVVIKPSKRKNKKLDVFSSDGHYITSVGDIHYKDYPTYLKEDKTLADEHRRRYKIRHAKDLKKVNSAGYWANILLW